MVVTDECLERFPTLSTGIRLTGKRNPLRLWIQITRREGAVATSRGSRFCFLDATITLLLTLMVLPHTLATVLEVERELGTMLNAFLGVDTLKR
ncbi:hypothetical protein F2Q69_00022909 [Brassica cretica]|uniref:Uncharacterized protein n=1 Tax=Brassica cretica TaxID=69181 RepID=A0A8S9QIS9_BRACR|nr:hypothetical protein F2Q69_00022909 [Brassica cretica]